MATYEWGFELTKDINITEGLITTIHEIFLDGFGLKQGWSRAGIQRAIQRSTILGLLKDEKQEPCGYAFYSVPDSLLDGTYVLWEDAICLTKRAQGNKLTSRRVFENACRLFPERKFGWIGGRTQNPKVFLRYARLGYCFPFDHLYVSEGKHVMDFLIRHIGEVSDVEQREKLVPYNGHCKNLYSEGRLGDYSKVVKEAEGFEKQLEEWNVNRDSGDAIIIMVRLDEPIQLV